MVMSYKILVRWPLDYLTLHHRRSVSVFFPLQLRITRCQEWEQTVNVRRILCLMSYDLCIIFSSWQQATKQSTNTMIKLIDSPLMEAVKWEAIDSLHEWSHQVIADSSKINFTLYEPIWNNCLKVDQLDEIPVDEHLLMQQFRAPGKLLCHWNHFISACT